MSKSALFFGYIGMGNVGDEAILSVLLREYTALGYDPIVLSANPDRTSKLHGVKSIKDKVTSIKFWRALVKSSELVVAGGGKYGDSTVRRLFLLTLLAKTLGKKVSFRGVGIYPYNWEGDPIIAKPTIFKSPLTRILLRYTFQKADHVSVRDDYSKRVLTLSGVERAIKVVSDPAFKLEPANPSKSETILREAGVDLEKKIIVGLNVRTLNPELNEKMSRIMSKFVDWIIDNYDAEVIFVPFGFGSFANRHFDDDRIIALKIKYLVKSKDKFKLIKEERHPSEILGMFRFFKVFVGMRYHSLIFSKVMGSRTIGIIYDTKSEELMKGCRNKIKIYDLTVDKLKEMFYNVMEG